MCTNCSISSPHRIIESPPLLSQRYHRCCCFSLHQIFQKSSLTLLSPKPCWARACLCPEFPVLPSSVAAAGFLDSVCHPHQTESSSRARPGSQSAVLLELLTSGPSIQTASVKLHPTKNFPSQMKFSSSNHGYYWHWLNQL